jgi:CBS domain-containing membrane protein
MKHETLRSTPTLREKVSYEPKVRDLMTSELVTLTPEDSVKAFADLIRWRGVRHVLIVGPEEELVGLFTQRDFLTISVSKLAHLSPQESDDVYSRIKLRDVMGQKLCTVTPDTPLREAAELMFKRKYGCLPVVDEGRLAGIITEADFVRAFLDWTVSFSRS